MTRALTLLILWGLSTEMIGCRMIVQVGSSNETEAASQDEPIIGAPRVDVRANERKKDESPESHESPDEQESLP